MFIEFHCRPNASKIMAESLFVQRFSEGFFIGRENDWLHQHYEYPVPLVAVG